MRQVSRRRAKRDRVSAERRREVWERGGGVCEWCHAAEMTDVHHRAGRVGRDPHRLENLVGLCWGCHQRVHGHPEWARSVGLMETRIAKSG